ncbi:MAG TPA: hypothetical protein VFT74_14150 [Isosphaeraceae bacterium]|nr:hypothetical protein [Isosphaeraceae bacterium]
MAKFEENCGACEGRGWDFKEGTFSKGPPWERVPCEYCNGKGVLVTANGERLICFLERWYGLKDPREKEAADG